LRLDFTALATRGRAKPRRQSYRVARCATRRRCLRLAPAKEEKGDFRRGDSLARTRNRRLHVGVPARRRSAAAASTGCGSRATVRSLSSRNILRWHAPNFRRLGVSGIPPDARRGQGSSRVDRSLVCGTHGSDLRVGSGDGERVLAICFRVDVRLIRTPARVGPPVYRKRRSSARSASVRGDFL
jgi:hypothetical protein